MHHDAREEIAGRAKKSILFLGLVVYNIYINQYINKSIYMYIIKNKSIYKYIYMNIYNYIYRFINIYI